ncbi:3076_t:CDS:2, partial [Funneliformis mosseae]
IHDPFRPLELNDKSRSKIGAPPKLSSKPRKPNRFNPYKKLSSDTFSIQQRKIKRTHNIKQNYNSFDNCGFQNFSQPPIIYDNVESQYNNVAVHENSCPYFDKELPNILSENYKSNYYPCKTTLSQNMI